MIETQKPTVEDREKASWDSVLSWEACAADSQADSYETEKKSADTFTTNCDNLRLEHFLLQMLGFPIDIYNILESPMAREAVERLTVHDTMW